MGAQGTGPAQQQPELCVIIPHYNDHDRLALCLEALCAQTLAPGRFEVIVVDNGSAEDPADRLSQRFGRVRFLREEKPGSYAARNAALAQSDSPFLAFTDSDCVPGSAWLAHGLQRLADDAGLGAVVGRIEIFPADPSRPRAAELFDMIHNLRQEAYLRDERFGATANLFVRRGAFDQAGVFNEAMRSGGDMEWGRRAHDAGVRFLYAPDALVRHPARADLRELIRKARRTTGGIVQKGAEARAASRRRGRLRHSLHNLRSAIRLLAPTRRSFARLQAYDGELSTRQRAAVAAVIVYLHYVRAMERVRVRFGGPPERR